MGLPPVTTTAAALATLAPRQSYIDHDGTPPVGALTTVWTAKEGCFPVSTRSTTDIDMFWTNNPECAPPGYASYFSTYYYSPAICPSGFTVGCSRYGDFQGPDVEPTETAMLCVMSDYFCTTDDWNYYATNTDLGYAQIMIEIRWAASDLSILETHPLTPGLILAGVTSGTTTRREFGTDTTRTGASTTVTALSDDSPHRQGGLTTGAQVGIGVGIGLFALLAIGIAIFFVMRYRRNRANVGKPPAQRLPPSQYPYPVHQYSYLPGPGQNEPPIQGYPGYTTYADPKTGAVTYSSAVPRPTEPGGTAIAGSNLGRSQGAPSTTGPQPIQAQGSTTNSTGAVPGALPVSQNTITSHLAPSETSGSGGATASTTGTENLQSQHEMAQLMAEQAKSEVRRARLMN
ncbi:hypothetical protein GGR53DRAFT_254036 [Hypoxylon sp. FL1150]|nr:hypothetical protein GGR53DRAFT_254036 [Hypoxylon sp. FL1150]